MSQLVKNTACQCRRYKKPGFAPELGKSLEEEKDNLFQYFCLECHRQKSLEATAHGVTESWTWLRVWKWLKWKAIFYNKTHISSPNFYLNYFVLMVRLTWILASLKDLYLIILSEYFRMSYASFKCRHVYAIEDHKSEL